MTQNGQVEEAYRVLLTGGAGEIVEKKSRFIATVRKCETEEEATQFVEEMKRKYWDARHNCSAFVIGNRGELTRCSDDGEPSGTAGRPMLEVLLGEQVRNVAVVVTRYFGGTLLGTGGLVRAYTQAVKEGLKNCQIGTLCPGIELTVRTDYNGIGKILHLLTQQGIQPVNSTYEADVVLLLRIPYAEADDVKKAMVEITNGKVVFEQEKQISFVV